MEQIATSIEALMPRFMEMGLNLLVAAAILIIGWLVSAIFGRWVQCAAQRSSHIDITVIPMFQSVVVWSIRVFIVVAVLARFGVQTASIIAVLGSGGLAIGLALQRTLQNIAAGIMLLMLRPVNTGEYVALSSGAEGTVQEVGLFLTKLVQGDGIQLTLPNSTLWGATITNFSRNSTRRVDIPVSIRYGDNLDAAMRKLNDLVMTHPAVLQDPAPLVKVIDYKDNGVVINVRAWAESSKYWEFRWGLYQQIRQTLEGAGFKAPIPVREIQTANSDGTTV